MIICTPRPLYRQRRTPVTLGGPQSLYGNFGEEKNLLPLTGFEPQVVQPVSLVTILRLRHTDCRKGASTKYFCVLCISVYTHIYLWALAPIL